MSSRVFASNRNFSLPSCSRSPRSLPQRSPRGLRVNASTPDKYGLDPKLEIAVPADQRPVNQLAELRTSLLYSWATLDLSDYVKRLALLWAFFFALIGGPIAYQTFDPMQQPLEFFLSGATGAFIVVAVAVVRIYLGWSYVGNRLLSASVEYEETGWYDGQLFVKPPEVLARDRLLGTYEVRPVLAKLKTTLIGSGVSLAALSLSLALLISAVSDADGVYGRGASKYRVPKVVSGGVGVVYSDVNLSDLASDDEAAAREAAAQMMMWHRQPPPSETDD